MNDIIDPTTIDKLKADIKKQIQLNKMEKDEQLKKDCNKLREELKHAINVNFFDALKKDKNVLDTFYIKGREFSLPFFPRNSNNYTTPENSCKINLLQIANEINSNFNINISLNTNFNYINNKHYISISQK